VGPFGAFQKQSRWRSLGGQHTARRTLVFDVGFNRGLTDTSTRWETFMGPTYLLPHRLWRKQGARLKSTLKGVNRESTIELCDRSHDRGLRLFGSPLRCAEGEGADRRRALPQRGRG